MNRWSRVRVLETAYPLASKAVYIQPQGVGWPSGQGLGLGGLLPSKVLGLKPHGAFSALQVGPQLVDSGFLVSQD